MTGLGRKPTAAALAGADIRAVCAQLWVPLPVDRLLDVGCGTGRLSALAGPGYLGLDIAPSAIRYCQERGILARLIDGPESLAVLEDDSFDWVWACSVFTHIGRDEQQRYLAQFVRLAPRLLVDILPGDPGRLPARWGSDENEFRADLMAAGYVIDPKTTDVVDGQGPRAPRHRYFTGRRA
jgi:SAM-dependent methyltransferase